MEHSQLEYQSNTEIYYYKMDIKILEDCCKKQGFLPPEDYSLMHGRTILDLTLSIRYLNLTNNAKLELVKAATPRRESEIVVALQLSDGTRLQKSFLPQVTLWEILEHWQKEADSSLQPLLTTEVDTSSSTCVHPICIYMREEIIGEIALKTTPLRKLGLTGGKAVIRLVHRQVDDVTYAQIIQKIDTETAKKMKLDQIAARHLREEKNERELRAVRDVGDSSSDYMMEVSQEAPNPVSATQPNMQISGHLTSPQDVAQRDQQREFKQQQQQKHQERNFANERLVHGETEGTTDAVQETNRETVKKIKMEAIADTHLRKGKTEKEMETVRDVGDSSSDCRMEISQEEHSSVSETQRNVQFSGHEENLISSQEMMWHDQQRTSTLQQQQQQELQDRTYSQESDKESDDFEIPERNTLIFYQGEKEKEQTTYEDPPDEFFEVTKADVMTMMLDLQKRFRDLENVPLMTKSAKEAKLFQKYAKYKKATIRIHFPDRMVLQGTFHPREDVAALHQFVRDNLEDSKTVFHLYISPPKQILKDTSENLISAKLVPASNVFFGSTHNKAPFLKADLSAHVTCKKDIDNSFPYSETNNTKETVSYKPPQPSTSQETPSTPKTSTPKPSGSQNFKNFVPKWFKLGQK
ncbi:tether containing UBX domain for GLUT4 isoform X2 [Octopus bimaculoides]|uniref:tether containing UBX domain for GLUT4 isoform X2 n=1 Tax=Octopus bimaculoides TaxID=37653 RepID=UPI00071D786A|nr:tether containing UBX domain for GLUT4 isoform X2 [Octopus bimaculoides]|eukprot:XP_014774030.1 PREDICTED: tether containing UBX domain for GLUT4-like isoform X2 [Octopus bimaculoides]